MKKTLLPISAILFAAAALVLAGCEQPSFTANPAFTADATTPIAAPVLKAEALPGAVLLSWEPVADVGSYKLYRTDGTTRLPVCVDTKTEAGYFVDKVDFDNTLKNGEVYTYTLEAVARSGSPLTSALSQPQTATAVIPARAPTIVTAPAADAVTVAPYVSPGTGVSNPDFLEVSWETGKAELPLTYRVEYIYADGQILPLVYNYSSSSIGDIFAKRVAFPLVGGDSTVRITASWGSNNYYAPASVTKAHTGAPTALPAVNYINSSTPVDGSLTLSWSAVTGAAGYDVYRAEITSGGPGYDGSVSIDDLTGAVIGAYSLITPNPGDTRQNGTTVFFTDAGYDSAKKWLYIVIARNGAVRSSAPALYARVPSTPYVPTPSSITVSAFQDTAAGSDAWKVSVSWDKNEGETYTLYRAPLEFANDGYTVTSIGAYTAIPAASLSEKDGKIIYIDAVGSGQLSKAQSYRYKVVAAKDGASNEITRDLTSTPFTKFISGAPTVTQGDSYREFKVRPFAPASYDNLAYELYAAESDGTRLTSGWTQITGTPDDNGDYTWDAPNTLKRYVFSQVTRSGAITLINSNAYTSTTSPYAPKLVASSSHSSGLFPSMLGQEAAAAGNIVLQFGPSLTPPPVDPPVNWWLQDGTYRTLFDAKIYRSARANTADYSTEAARTSVATVQFNNSPNSITKSTVTIPAWTFYIELPKHHTMTDDGSENWYFGVEYNNGYTASDITTNNYYTIDKTGATVTVSSVN